MKPLREKDIDRTDNRWCRIDYITKSGCGSYIIKRNILETNQKKFDKLLRDCVSVGVDTDYHINMYDIIESALRTIEDKIMGCNVRIHWYRNEPEEKSIYEREKERWIIKQIRLERMLVK